MVVECLQNLGSNKTEEEILQLGLEIQKLRIKTKLQFGFKYDTLIEKIPKRIYEMPTAHGLLSKTQLGDLINTYKVLLKERYQRD
jgi:hypothetical protein